MDYASHKKQNTYERLFSQGFLTKKLLFYCLGCTVRGISYMNKLVAVLGIVIILLCAGCGILCYQIGDMQSQNSDLQNEIGQLENQVSELELENLELQNQTDELKAYINNVSDASQVRITGITFTPTKYVKVIIESNITVTVKNFGTNDVSGLTLWLKDFRSGNYFGEIALETLRAGESQNATVGVRRGIGDYVFAYVTTLMLDDVILDLRVNNYAERDYSKVY